MRAVFARRRLSNIERIVLTPALSLTVLVFGGILLYLAHIRLTVPAWALLSGGVAVVGALIAYSRTGGAPVSFTQLAGSFGRSVKARWLVPALIAALLLGGAGWISLHTAAVARNSVAVTALSMLPTDPTATGPTRAVAIDITTENAPIAGYRLAVSAPGNYHVVFQPNPGRDGHWRHAVTVRAAGRVTADLYRTGDTTPYRSVFLDLS
jgi:hypothetical protein